MPAGTTHLDQALPEAFIAGDTASSRIDACQEKVPAKAIEYRSMTAEHDQHEDDQLPNLRTFSKAAELSSFTAAVAAPVRRESSIPGRNQEYPRRAFPLPFFFFSCIRTWLVL
jgi:hypothetical protein